MTGMFTFLIGGRRLSEGWIVFIEIPVGYAAMRSLIEGSASPCLDNGEMPGVMEVSPTGRGNSSRDTSKSQGCFDLVPFPARQLGSPVEGLASR